MTRTYASCAISTFGGDSGDSGDIYDCSSAHRTTGRRLARHVAWPCLAEPAPWSARHCRPVDAPHGALQMFRDCQREPGMLFCVTSEHTTYTDGELTVTAQEITERFGASIEIGVADNIADDEIFLAIPDNNAYARIFLDPKVVH